MTTTQNQTLQEIASDNTYKNCSFHIYGDNQDIQNCHFEDCKFNCESVIIYGMKNCTITGSQFTELRIAKEISEVNINDCTIKYLNLEATKIADKTFSFISDNNAIEKLNLHWTDLHDIAPQILQLKTLKGLYLGNNYIETLPEDIVRLFQLQLLDLSDNKIESLPQSFSQLENLNVLGLSGNQVNQIPPGIQNMKRLQELVLDKAKFTTDQQKVIREYLPNCNVYFE